MPIWSAEIKELETLYASQKGCFPELDKEWERLIRADDENMVLVYSRRCLEVIISDLCINELKRPRKTEPLKGIIDKLAHEEKVPSNIIASMDGLNSLSTFGAHPKDFDPEQVKPVLNNLTIIIKWFLKYKNFRPVVSADKALDELTKQEGKKIKEGTVIGQAQEEYTPGPEPKTVNILLALWKRGVPQITAGYFITAWIIIKFLDWILARYDLSDRWADIAMIVLLAMIPSVMIYIYNRERINHGKLSLIEKITFPVNIIIAILLVFLLSKGTPLNAMTETVTVIDESGRQETRKVFKENYITKLAIFPFMDESKDSSDNWLGFGVFRAISENLQQFNYISVWRKYDAISLQEQISSARTNNYPYFLTGSIRLDSGIYEITSRIHRTSNGSITAERIFWGSDFFSLIDSISMRTRIDLGISKSIMNSSTDLPFKEHVTGNLSAFENYIRGLYIDSFYFHLIKALELDSTFALAAYTLADQHHQFQISNKSARKYINLAMRHRQRLSEYGEISIRTLYYLILGENEKAVALSEMQYELNPNDVQLLTELIYTYWRNLLTDKEKKAVERLNKLVPDHPEYRIELAKCYLFTGKFGEGLEVLSDLLKDNPENIRALMQEGEIYLHMNNLDAAEEVYKKAILLMPEAEKYWSKLFDHITYSRNNTLSENSLVPFIGIYRAENTEMNTYFSIINHHLVLKAETQGPVFLYPVSDTQFVTVVRQPSSFSFVTLGFTRNDQGRVIKILGEQINDNNAILWEQWKEDSLILAAKELLDQNKIPEALNSFLLAYDQYPGNYYLANFITHLEFIRSKEYEKLKPVFESYLGKYGDARLYKENDQIRYEDQYGIYQMLPLSEKQFMIPSLYGPKMEIVKDKNSISGLKFVYRDGTEEFHSRSN